MPAAHVAALNRVALILGFPFEDAPGETAVEPVEPVVLMSHETGGEQLDSLFGEADPDAHVPTIAGESGVASCVRICAAHGQSLGAPGVPT